MCTFITSVAPIAPGRKDFRSVVDNYGLLFEPIENVHVTAQLRTNESYFHVTKLPCDCGTTLLSHPPSLDSPQVEKLRRQGWSETKIQRWLRSKSDHANRGDPPTGELTQQQWAAFLDDTLALPDFPYIGLLTHFYRVGTEHDEFDIKERVPVLPSLVVEGMGRWRDDVVYEFNREGGFS